MKSRAISVDYEEYARRARIRRQIRRLERELNTCFRLAERLRNEERKGKGLVAEWEEEQSRLRQTPITVSVILHNENEGMGADAIAEGFLSSLKKIEDSTGGMKNFLNMLAIYIANLEDKMIRLEARIDQLYDLL